MGRTGKLEGATAMYVPIRSFEADFFGQSCYDVFADGHFDHSVKTCNDAPFDRIDNDVPFDRIEDVK